MILTLGRMRRVRPLRLSRRPWLRLRAGFSTRGTERLLHALALRWRQRRAPSALTRMVTQRVSAATAVGTLLTQHVHSHVHFARTPRPWSDTSLPVSHPSMQARPSAAGDATPLRSRTHSIGARLALAGRLWGPQTSTTRAAPFPSMARAAGAPLVRRRAQPLALCGGTISARLTARAASAAHRIAVSTSATIEQPQRLRAPRSHAGYFGTEPRTQSTSRGPVPSAQGPSKAPAQFALGSATARVAPREPVRNQQAPLVRHGETDAPGRRLRDAVAGNQLVPLVWRSTTDVQRLMMRDATQTPGPGAPRGTHERNTGSVDHIPTYLNGIPRVVPSPSLPFDAATVDRLADDIMRRIERRARIERERRGL